MTKQARHITIPIANLYTSYYMEEVQELSAHIAIMNRNLCDHWPLDASGPGDGWLSEHRLHDLGLDSVLLPVGILLAFVIVFFGLAVWRF